MTDRLSIVELDLFTEAEGPGTWFWFTRLKAKIEGEGEGSFLMRELVAICDEKGYSIYCFMNPYGNLDCNQLRRFYKKFGFVDHPEYEEVVLRYPGIRR